jgi:hypothetical protein
MVIARTARGAVPTSSPVKPYVVTRSRPYLGSSILLARAARGSLAPSRQRLGGRWR